jgi:predicted glycosyltransferase
MAGCMKIVFYCQHVLGIGHVFRSLEICRALAGHAVTLVSGGPPLAAPLPANVTEFRLPALAMDPAFSGLVGQGAGGLAQVKEERRDRLRALFEQNPPELFLVELYPFGRKAFAFEIDPLLEAIAAGRFAGCGVVCSLRDILVEKDRPEKHERRTVALLNRYFDAVLVHADPALVRLDETFSRLEEIGVPIHYTGFVAPRPGPGAGRRVRQRLNLGAAEGLIVASAGGGSVGAPLLEAVLRAFAHLPRRRACRMLVFTGPFLPEDEFLRLRRMAGSGIEIERFSPDFLSCLAAADLSVSMAGYNTTMNLLAAGVPALVWPFGQNREQRMRSERLEALGALKVLRDEDLDPQRLAALIEAMPGRGRQPALTLDLSGAETTARWVEGWRREPLRGRYS